MSTMRFILLLTFFYLCSNAEYLDRETPYVGVVGEDAYLNWTISNLVMDTTRYVRNPAGNASLMVFFSNQLSPYIVDTRANFTGDLLQGIVSFTLSNVTLSDAGKYTFTKTAGTTTLILGAQVLVVAENPTIPKIISLSLSAVAGQEYQLNCSTESRSAPSNHNLTMYSEWKKNGVNITVGAGFSVNGMILTVSNLDRKDNGDKVSCRTFEDKRRRSAESGELVLDVLYGPDNVQITPSGELAVSEGGNVNITCKGECNPPCGIYQWRKDFMPIVVGSSQSYFIPEITRNHSAVYICTVTNVNTSKNATEQIIVRVNYGPDVSSITLSPSQISYKLVEFSPLSVNCSADCYPRCQYTWTGPGVGNYGNSGMLSIPEMKRNQAGVLTCTATNPEIANKSTTANISITVLYGPDSDGITLYPAQSSYEQVEYFPFFINCSADCYPYCHYTWSGPGVGSNENTSVLYIPEIKRNQTGVFTCTVTNPAITNKSSAAKINVTVFYGPDTPLQIFPPNTNYRLMEGATIPDIYCTSNCFPSCLLNWTGPVPSSNGVVSLGKVNRTMKGNYTCMGQNPRTHINTYSNVVTVVIIYGPDTPVLTPNYTEYTLNESIILPNISCSAHCFPICLSFWYKEQTDIPVVQGNTLSLGDVYRNDSGNYACKFENMESKAVGESAIRLVVHYPPTISLESRNGSFSETGLMINCSAHGIPERYIFSLIHSSLFSGIKIRQLIDNEHIYTGVLVHSFRNPSFMDTGVYTCVVRNGVLDYRDESMNKNVSMTVWIKGPPSVTSSDRDFYGEMGASGILVIEFYNSLLDVNVTWNKQRIQTIDKLESSDKYNISIASTNVTVQFYSVLIQQPGIIAILDIKNMTNEDFGSYNVYLENSAGNLSDLILKLRPKGRPDPPDDVHIIPSNVTSSSVYIEWMSGLHGGSNQTFVIEYKTQADEKWTTYSYDVFGGMILNKNFNVTVDDLRQDTLYFFRMHSWNLFGKSKYSVVINATTFSEGWKPALNGNGGGLGTGPIVAIAVISTCIVVIAFIVVACYRKRLLYEGRSSRQSRPDTSTNKEDISLDTRITAAATTIDDTNQHPAHQHTTMEMKENINLSSSDSDTIGEDSSGYLVPKSHFNDTTGEVHENLIFSSSVSDTSNKEHVYEEYGDDSINNLSPTLDITGEMNENRSSSVSEKIDVEPVYETLGLGNISNDITGKTKENLNTSSSAYVKLDEVHGHELTGEDNSTI